MRRRNGSRYRLSGGLNSSRALTEDRVFSKRAKYIKRIFFFGISSGHRRSKVISVVCIDQNQSAQSSDSFIAVDFRALAFSAGLASKLSSGTWFKPEWLSGLTAAVFFLALPPSKNDGLIRRGCIMLLVSRWTPESSNKSLFNLPTVFGNICNIHSMPARIKPMKNCTVVQATRSGP